eukprot:Amastigsp_a1734_148.p3 type:complete len:162 gc:universal Amastigsp_a1734_148:155-640(+)
MRDRMNQRTMITMTAIIRLSFMFCHHITFLSCVDFFLKTCDDSLSWSVRSTRSSILSPRSKTFSMLSTMTSRTPSICDWIALILSDEGSLKYSIRERSTGWNLPLNAYAMAERASAAVNCWRNRCWISRRNAKGILFFVSASVMQTKTMSSCWTMLKRYWP